MSRETDVKIAVLLGLNVVGEDWCWEADGCWLTCEEQHKWATMQPLYAKDCVCDDPELEEWYLGEKRFGHYVDCMDVVPFYSEIDAVALAELEPKMPMFRLQRLRSLWQCQSRHCGDWFDHPVRVEGEWMCSCRFGDGHTIAEAVANAYLELHDIKTVSILTLPEGKMQHQLLLSTGTCLKNRETN